MSSEQYVVAAPYPEGAIVKIAEELSSKGRLWALFMPSRRISRGASKVAKVLRHGNMGGRLSRGAQHLPQLVEVAGNLELIRLASRLPFLGRAFVSPMAQIKRQFDHAVAGRLRNSNHILIGMPGASLEAFSSDTSAHRVLHEVDAHPRARNAILLAHYGPGFDREVVPEGECRRIEAELALADTVLSPSSLVTRQLISQGVTADKIVQIPFGVDLSRFAPIRINRMQARPRLIYVGQISYRKGIPFLLSAAQGGNFDIVMIGPVVAPELVTNLPSNVSHLQPVTHEALAAELAGADAFVFPSLEDNFALVILEAVAAGLPVITTDGTGSSELLSASEATVVPAGDVNALQTAMEAIGPLDWQERDSRATAARIRFAAEDGLLSWPSYARQVIAAIDARI